MPKKEAWHMACILSGVSGRQTKGVIMQTYRLTFPHYGSKDFLATLLKAVGSEHIGQTKEMAIVYVEGYTLLNAKVHLFQKWCKVSTQHFPMSLREIVAVRS